MSLRWSREERPLGVYGIRTIRSVSATAHRAAAAAATTAGVVAHERADLAYERADLAHQRVDRATKPVDLRFGLPLAIDPELDWLVSRTSGS